MNISLTEWAKYRETLQKLCQKASDEYRDYFFHVKGAREGRGLKDVSRELAIEVAYAIITKYAEGSAELACEMYDMIAELSGVNVAAAVPAQTATMDEVGKIINGVLKQSPSGNLLDSAIQRVVKQAAADTTLQNAQRDGAQFAWIPYSDTCPFCLTLASRGWQYMSKKAMQNGHAEHIHGHCDCQYAIRFDKNTNVEGYDPEHYKRIYYSHPGSPQDKINAMRREDYAFKKDEINERKRELYKINRERSLSKQLQFEYNGHKEFIPQDALITKAKAIAGKGSDVIFRRAQDYADAYGGNAEDWSKMVGVVESAKYIFDIHWAEKNDLKVIDPKIKNYKVKNED